MRERTAAGDRLAGRANTCNFDLKLISNKKSHHLCINKQNLNLNKNFAHDQKVLH